MGTLSSSVTPLKGGTTAVAATNKVMRFNVTGTWAVGDTFNISLNTPINGITEVVGNGKVTGKVPTFLLNYKSKLNGLYSTYWFFSAVRQPTIFNNLTSAGNDRINLAENYFTDEELKSLVVYQGKMAVFASDHVQIWQVGADPNNYTLLQVLPNVRTLGKLTPQPLGELDILFLEASGVRSLRVRDNTLNAVTVDIGSPIDQLVQAKLAECTETEKQAACGIFEPTSNRYWLFLKDTIYVLSDFGSAKITAWSEYKPYYQQGLLTSGLAFLNLSSTSTYIVRFGMVDDLTQATQTFTVAPLTPITEIRAANYYWILSADGETVVASGAITNGVRFVGVLSISNLGVVSLSSNFTTFVPQKFLVHKKQVFARTSTGLVAYGGATGAVYDNSVAYWKTPWLDAESADKSKFDDGINVSMQGAWSIYASADYLTEEFSEVLAAISAPTYDGGKIPFSSVGTHYAFSGISSAASRAVFSAISLFFK